MNCPAPRVLVIGGNSAIAQHLFELLPDARGIARTSDSPRVMAVGDYGLFRAVDFEGVNTVVNCAGIVKGSDSELRAVNVELQSTLARSARSAGVARFITLGSFSIFGACERVDLDSAAAPSDAYGRSKHEGEQALAAMQGPDFAVLCVAFPAILNTRRPGKVERMLRIWRRLGRWPIPSGDIRRSMIGVGSAARVLAYAVGDDRTGRVLAADPVAFEYRTAARWLRADTGGRFGLVTVPPAGLDLMRRCVPSLHRSMMADSILDSGSNYMAQCGIQSSLRRDLVTSVTREIEDR